VTTDATAADMTSAGPDRARERRDLLDERAFLLRSLADLDAEKDVGDLSATDYEALRDEYTARAAAVLRALEALDDAATAPDVPPIARAGSEPSGDAGHGAAPTEATVAGTARRRRRRVLVGGAVAAFALAAVVLVVAEVAARLPGQTSSGSVALNRAQQIEQTLAQAEALETAGNGAQALTLYRKVLSLDPTQAEALAEAGWLEYEAGVSAGNATAAADGQRTEETAERVDPGAYAPHLYLGSMLLAENQAPAAVTQFAAFLADGPPTAVVQNAWPFVVQAYRAAGQSPPMPPAGVHG